MNNKTCATCINNDNGLCDRKGILIQEDDTCDKHREDWRQQMLSKFDRREWSMKVPKEIASKAERYEELKKK